MKKTTLVGLVLVVISGIIGIAVAQDGLESAFDYSREMIISSTICGHLNSLEEREINISFDRNLSAAIFILKRDRPGIDIKFKLYSPSHILIEPCAYDEKNITDCYFIPAPLRGNWTVNVSARKLPKDGGNYCVFSNKPGSQSKKENEAIFNGLYRNYGKDFGQDGKYEYITIKVGISVRVPGFYQIDGTIYDMTGKRTKVQNGAVLQLGAQFIPLVFDIKSPGPYRLQNLTLYDRLGNELDHSDTIYNIKKYDYLNPVANLTGYYTDQGRDVNRDSLYDYLRVNVGVNVFNPGDYFLNGYLYDIDGAQIAWTVDRHNLSMGSHILHLDFIGLRIQKHNKNGPYYLRNLTLARGNSSKGFELADIVMDAYITSAYNCSDFAENNKPTELQKNS